jgi:SNF family Na+-dependent transporter
MVPYFIALFVLGLPLAWGEWAMGRYGGARGYNSSPGIYRVVWRHPVSPYLGVLGMVVPVVIYMYYVVIESWCLAYAWFYLDGTMKAVGEAARAAGGAGKDGVISKQPFTDLLLGFIGANEDGSAFKPTGLFFLAFCFIANFVLIYRGLSKGIERFCLWAMPALVVCALLVLLRVLTLSPVEGRTVSDALGFMWNPRAGQRTFMESLANPKMWMDATGQIFFTLSVGFGIIVTYASYLKRKDDVALSSLTSCAGNEFCEVALGGMITVPAAFLYLGATAVTAASGSTFNLGFMTLPMVFEQMPLGYVAGFLFFFLLFLAAITSSISMLQPAIALLEEGLGVTRRASVAILGFVTLCGTMFTLYFSKGTVALDTLDTWVGVFFIYLLAIYQTLLFGWAMGPRAGLRELEEGAAIRVPRVVGFVLQWVAPAYLMVILGAFVYGEWGKGKESQLAKVVSDPVVGLSVGFVGAVTVFFLLVIAQAVRRWERAEAQASVVVENRA